MGDLVVAASSFLQAGTVVTASTHECGVWDVKQDGEKTNEMGSVLWLLSGRRWLEQNQGRLSCIHRGPLCELWCGENWKEKREV